MANIPSGTVTFLFTDIEGSTKLAQEHPTEMPVLLERHNEILNQATEKHNGYVFNIVGDSFAIAFHSASDALNAAMDAQRALQSETWNPAPIKVRMGIHTGAAQLDADNQYSGYATLASTQRIMSAGHGGQVLLSGATYELTRNSLPIDIELIDLDERRLKDLLRPEHLYQVNIAGLQTNFPPLKTLDEFRTNLPAQLTSFIGREKEVAQIKKRLEKNRLVTLTGSGGIGKTRLSIQVASELLGEYPNGVWLIELAPLTDPALVPQAICTILDVNLQGNASPLKVLTEYLHAKKLLLVIDNCEHLIDACAQICETILLVCPNIRVIASSREALGIDGENSYHVPSLSLPDPKSGLATIEGSEAVKLFMERATAVLPEFEITESNASSVAKICLRLDGIALAIELAASRVKILKVEQIASRLEDAFRLLTGGSRTALPRQQTLRALIDWSYNLLSEPEKILFRRLAVFAGGWTMEAAEAVCSGGGNVPKGGIETEDVLDLMAHLVDKSLIVVISDRTESRYRRLETIRQYAREKLAESGESETLRNRHMEYFCQLVERFEPGLRGPDQVVLLDSLETELDNLRAALEWSLYHDISEGLRMAARLKWFWHLRYQWSEGTGWLDKLLSAESEKLSNGFEASSSAFDRAKGLLALSYLSIMQGETQKATVCIEESVVLCERMEGKDGISLLAESYQNLGVGELLINGDLKQAEMFAERSRALHQSCGNKFGVAEVQVNIFMVIALHSGEFETARLLTESNLAIRQELGDKDGIAYELENGGKVAVCQGDYERAKKLFLAAIEASHEARSDYSLGNALGNLGVAYLFNGEMDLALDCFLKVVKLAQEKWHTIHKTGCICWLAMYSFEQKQFRKFILLNSFLERENSLALYLYFFPIVQKTLQKNVVTARMQLNQESLNSAEAEGKAMTLDQAFAYAVGGIDE